MATKYYEIALVEPSYMTLTSYEKNFDLSYWRKLWGDYWIFSAYASVVYVILLFGGRLYMANRPPFKLNALLTLWNIGLAAMSIWAFLRVSPELFHTLTSKDGLYHSICEWKDHNGATAFWCFVLLLSKVVELGDTAFIVLRKQNLLFLHWYHHVTTLMSWWVMYHWYEPNQLIYVVMNSGVHSLMYTYYALRSMKVKVPRSIAMVITTLQLMQMVVGVLCSVYTVYQMHFNGTPKDCPHRNWFGLQVSLAIYVPYTILFAKLFIDSYMVKGKGKKIE